MNVIISLCLSVFLCASVYADERCEDMMTPRSWVERFQARFVPSVYAAKVARRVNRHRIATELIRKIEESEDLDPLLGEFISKYNTALADATLEGVLVDPFQIKVEKGIDVRTGESFYLSADIKAIFYMRKDEAKYSLLNQFERTQLIEFDGNRLLSTETFTGGQAEQYTFYQQRWLSLYDVSPMEMRFRLSGERFDSRAQIADHIVQNLRGVEAYSAMSENDLQSLKLALTKNRLRSFEVWQLVNSARSR